MNKKYLKILAFIYTAMILVLAVLPANKRDNPRTLDHYHVFHIRLDYFLHGAIFIPWVVLIWLVTRFSFITAPLKSSWILAACLLYASFTEYIQLLVPSRSFSYIDMVSNFTGVLLGFVILLSIKN